MNGKPYTNREDILIRKFAGLKSAQQIGLMLNRPKSGIHHRIKHLSLRGHLYGAHHWAAKVDSLSLAMIHTLLDAGFTPTEIFKMFSSPLNITEAYISQIASAKYRKRG